MREIHFCVKLKTQRYPVLIGLILFALTIGCRDEDTSYGPEVDLTGCSFSNTSANYDYRNSDTIPANSYQVIFELQTDNDYALEYGINPQVQNKISQVEITTLSDLNGYAEAGSLVNDFFLVYDTYEYDRIYSTINDFISNEGVFKRLDSGRLIFTNQNRLDKPYSNIIAEGDTVQCQFRIKVSFDNQLSVQQTLSVTLTGNHEF